MRRFVYHGRVDTSGLNKVAVADLPQDIRERLEACWAVGRGATVITDASNGRPVGVATELPPLPEGFEWVPVEKPQ